MIVLFDGWDINGAWMGQLELAKFANNDNRLFYPTVENGAPGRYLSIFKFTASRN